MGAWAFSSKSCLDFVFQAHPKCPFHLFFHKNFTKRGSLQNRLGSGKNANNNIPADENFPTHPMSGVACSNECNFEERHTTGVASNTYGVKNPLALKTSPVKTFQKAIPGNIHQTQKTTKHPETLRLMIYCWWLNQALWKILVKLGIFPK